MKRFWDKAAAEPTETGWVVLLDGRPMRLPGGPELRVGSLALAEALAAEWQAAGGGKGGEVTAEDLKLTQLAGTAQERIAGNPAPTVEALARYAESDLLCYRAEGPETLARRQAEAWQPWLDWAALEYDAPLKVTTGVMHTPQDETALETLRRAVAAQDAMCLAGLGMIVPALGSLVLGLALAAGRLEPEQAVAAAFLDETFQAEFWGEDAEAAARRRRVGDEVATAAHFIRLSRHERG